MELLRANSRLFRLGSWIESRPVAQILRQETIGGVLLLGAALLGMVWANTPWSGAYDALREYRVGPAALHLDLTLSSWAADGLLAIFFFVAGLELKREFVAGDLRDPRRAAVPVAAALGGVVVPALVYLAIAGGAGDGAGRGWAVPTATDIAFALAVLAVAGRRLPGALRTFMLTLAVVDDLVAILVIALFYTAGLTLLPLLGAAATLAAFAAVVRRPGAAWWLLPPLAFATWALVHASGVHATVAGVLLAFAVPVGFAERFEHHLRPLSAGFAVPVFAFLAAGVTVGGLGGLADALTGRVALGIVAALVVGKAAGITLATWLVARFTKASLDEGLRWADVLALGTLGGVGFTVSLLLGELAFGHGTARAEQVTVAVVAGSVVAALVATVLLRLRGWALR